MAVRASAFWVLCVAWSLLVANVDCSVVEDNDINQRVLRKQLETAPGNLFQVHMASNGQQAVELSAQTRLDLILMDVEMPVMDGLEATARIRERERSQGTPPIPIIGLSGNARRVRSFGSPWADC